MVIGLTSRRSQPPLARSVPLSRFTPRVGGGSAFFVRPICTRLVSSPPDWFARLQDMRADWLHSMFWFMSCSVYAEATSLVTRSVPEYTRGQFGHRMDFMTHTTRRQVPSPPQTDATAHFGAVSGRSFYHCGYLIFPMFTNLGHRNYRPNMRIG